MSKVYQHKFLSDLDEHYTVASSNEISGAVCGHLEKTVCRLNNNMTDHPAVFVTPLTSDTVIIGNCSYNRFNPKNEIHPAEYNYFHSYIISNSDIANIINRDPYFLSKIDFEKSLPQKGSPNAETISKLPISQQTLESKKISGTMLQNTFCSMMDIISGSQMKYMSIDEPFSPFEIIGLAYSVLPIHAAIAFSYVTYTADIPNVKYNICFSDRKTVEHIKPQYRMTASSLFSGNQPISIVSYPRLSSLIDQSSADLGALKRFYMFAYDFINIINKYAKDKLNPMNPALYETLLCIYTYSTKLLSVSRENLPGDIVSALEYMDGLMTAYPQAKDEINILVPTKPKDENMISITPAENKSKRAERETALKILSLITTTPEKISEFTETKLLIIREAQMGTFSLNLFQKVLRDALKSFDFSSLDDSQLLMAAYAVSLAFETIDYRVYGGQCISYPPYNYVAMFEFVANVTDNSKLFYKKLVSLHKHVNPVLVSAYTEYKPSKLKKEEKEKAKAEKIKAKAAQKAKDDKNNAADVDTTIVDVDISPDSADVDIDAEIDIIPSHGHNDKFMSKDEALSDEFANIH